MLLMDAKEIGNKLLTVRKRAGMTQMEVAEAANMSDRSYADIERGVTNARVETILRICNALKITPNEILTDEPPASEQRQEELFARLNECPAKYKEMALNLLSAFLQSLP